MWFKRAGHVNSYTNLEITTTACRMKVLRHKSRLLRFCLLSILVFVVFYSSRIQVCEISIYFSKTDTNNSNLGKEIFQNSNSVENEGYHGNKNKNLAKVSTKVPIGPELRKLIIRMIENKFDKDFDNSEHSIYTNKQLGQIPVTSGYMNNYIWPDVCKGKITFLKAKLDFPFNPLIKKNIANLSSILISKNSTGMRIFGYIVPPLDGKYRILVSTIGTIEAWISVDQYPENASRIWFEENEFTFKFQKNQPHYFEIMYVSNEKEICNGTLSILWIRPQAQINLFEEIPSKYLTPYVVENLEIVIPETYRSRKFKMHILDENWVKILDQTDNGVKDEYKTYKKFANSGFVHHVTDKCEYKPYFVESLQVNESYDLIYSKHSRLYPHITPYFDFIERRVLQLNSKEAKKVAAVYYMYLKKNYELLKLHSIVQVEKVEDPVNGDLYFAELLVFFATSTKIFTIFDYLVLNSKIAKNKICFPDKMLTRRNTFIHVLVTHRNFPTMMRYFVENWEMIYEVTGDENFELIVMNYPSPQLDVERLLKQSKIKQWRLIELTDPFIKVAAINIGVDSVSNPNDIIFTTDLSLRHPPDILDSIRKHTYKDYSVYGPIAYYFACDYFKHRYFSDYGFGVLSLYVSDWIKLHGMNTAKFGEEWGFEDNDFATRILQSGYLIIRLDLRGFYHQHHPYAGLWKFNE